MRRKRDVHTCRVRCMCMHRFRGSEMETCTHTQMQRQRNMHTHSNLCTHTEADRNQDMYVQTQGETDVCADTEEERMDSCRESETKRCVHTDTDAHRCRCRKRQAEWVSEPGRDTCTHTHAGEERLRDMHAVVEGQRHTDRDAGAHRHREIESNRDRCAQIWRKREIHSWTDRHRGWETEMCTQTEREEETIKIIKYFKNSTDQLNSFQKERKGSSSKQLFGLPQALKHLFRFSSVTPQYFLGPVRFLPWWIYFANITSSLWVVPFEITLSTGIYQAVNTQVSKLKHQIQNVRERKKQS